MGCLHHIDKSVRVCVCQVGGGSSPDTSFLAEAVPRLRCKAERLGQGQRNRPSLRPNGARLGPCPFYDLSSPSSLYRFWVPLGKATTPDPSYCNRTSVL